MHNQVFPANFLLHHKNNNTIIIIIIAVVVIMNYYIVTERQRRAYSNTILSVQKKNSKQKQLPDFLSLASNYFCLENSTLAADYYIL